MASTEILSYTSVRTTLRPPRVVIVVDGGQHWSYWVRRALYRADRAWGGAGFAVVPHRGGQVDAVLLRACEAYDPDFVVTYSPTVDDVENLRPGWFTVSGDDGEPLSGDERERMLSMVLDDAVPSSDDHAAREQIVSVCSPYASRRGGGWYESVEYLGDEPTGHFPNVVNMSETWHASVLACPAHWGGVLGAAVANHAGVAAPPEHNAEEPVLGDALREQLVGWLLDDPSCSAPDELVWHPGVAVGMDTKTMPTAHTRSKTHLVEVHTGFDIHRTGLLVVGDSAEDFALARLWQLTFGTGFWLPSSLLDGEGTARWRLGHRIARIARDLARNSNRLAITSISRSEKELEVTRDRVVEANQIKIPGQQDPGLDVILSPKLPWQQQPIVSLAVEDQWDSQVTVPISVAEDGTRRMAAPLPAPVLVSADLAAQEDLQWHVDVHWEDSRAVRRRGLDSIELFGNRPAFMSTWARSSRHGMTYQSRRNDFVTRGTRPENTLARVALRELSLAAWIRAKAAERDLVARPSEAGLRTGLLADMLGGREQYVDVFGGVLLPALRGMLATSSTSKVAYPDGDGVSLSSREGVLTFAGMCARVAGLDEADVRSRVDAVLRAGVLRRGLVLLCSTCQQKQFQTIDRLGQRWRCVRCDALNDLDQAAWKLPVSEPTWFYDLHPVGRHVLAEHGEVSALLSAYLRTTQKDQRKTFVDVDEVMFLDGGKPQVEVDLISYADDVLTVAECKSGSELTGREAKLEVEKKCRVAAWLRADRLLFATSAEAWTPVTMGSVRDIVRDFSGWGTLGSPDVRFISGLGRNRADVVDESGI
ncbi:hypothetical protein [Amycolatopsis sp. NPDC004169]|uniref:hypothetical protein n=1 Tax=Amycolatopsis sp. NPDC004169 TaxID=3154453 RepID=UPI0033A1D370